MHKINVKRSFKKKLITTVCFYAQSHISLNKPSSRPNISRPRQPPPSLSAQPTNLHHRLIEESTLQPPYTNLSTSRLPPTHVNHTYSKTRRKSFRPIFGTAESYVYLAGAHTYIRILRGRVRAPPS